MVNFFIFNLNWSANLQYIIQLKSVNDKIHVATIVIFVNYCIVKLFIMKPIKEPLMPVGTKSMLMSKLYYGVLTKKLEHLDVERYFTVLFFLNENNGCKQQFICDHLMVDKTAMVKIIDYLIKTGMVDRNVNPDDRREHFIVLTKKGQRCVEEIVNAFNLIDKAMLANVSEEEKAIFFKVLEQSTSNLQNLPFDDLFFNFKKTGKKKNK